MSSLKDKKAAALSAILAVKTTMKKANKFNASQEEKEAAVLAVFAALSVTNALLNNALAAKEAVEEKA